MMQARIEDKALTDDVDVAARCCHPCWPREEHVKQIWTNLISNAIKYTPAGRADHRTARARGRPSAQLQRRIRASASSPEEQEHIFEDFYRTEEAKAMARHGTGLGLSIVKGSWSAMAGASGSNRGGRGSAPFRLRCPLPRRCSPVLVRPSCCLSGTAPPTWSGVIRPLVHLPRRYNHLCETMLRQGTQVLGFHGQSLTKRRQDAQSFFGRIAGLFRRARSPDETWDELEMLLIQADVGVETTDELIDELRAEAERRAVRSARAGAGAAQRRTWWLAPASTVQRAYLAGERLLNVVLVVGVNGSGKTTSIAKLAQYHKRARRPGAARRRRHLPRRRHRPAAGSGASASGWR